MMMTHWGDPPHGELPTAERKSRASHWLRLLLANPAHDTDAAERLWDIVNCSLGFWGVALMVIELELAFDPETHARVTTVWTELLRLLILLSTLLLLVSLALYYVYLQSVHNLRSRASLPRTAADGDPTSTDPPRAAVVAASAARGGS